MSCVTLPRVPKTPGIVILFLLVLAFWQTSACAPTPKRVVIIADGARRVVDTNAATVQDVLREQKITLGDNDQVDPPLYAEVDRSATITVTRLGVSTMMVQQPIPFERKLVRDESYPEGQMRVLQLGANGQVEITYTIASENGIEISRRESGRQIVTQPTNEILAIGTLGSVPAVAITGSVVYLANGNAWVMRNTSDNKRPLTSTGDLDGRAFALSADGRYLLFSRAADPSGDSLNTLWIMDTLILGETPHALPVSDVLYATLSADGRSVVYSTGEKTAGAPGWKAHNDLWSAPLPMSAITGTQQVSITLDARPVWSPGMPAPYGWWGPNLAVAPDGRAIAYAFANGIGFSEIDPGSGKSFGVRQSLKEFAPFRTNADWVWVPKVAWSPDSRFVIAAVHSPLDPMNVANENPSFEIWALARDGTVHAPLARQTGMWADPVWSPPDANGESKIAYGVALSPSDSERSRYALYTMDRDGANKTQIFPRGNEDGLTVVQVAWAPGARQLIAVRDDDLWLYDFGKAQWSQLTANGASALPRWGK